MGKRARTGVVKVEADKVWEQVARLCCFIATIGHNQAMAATIGCSVILLEVLVVLLTISVWQGPVQNLLELASVRWMLQQTVHRPHHQRHHQRHPHRLSLALGLLSKTRN